MDPRSSFHYKNGITFIFFNGETDSKVQLSPPSQTSKILDQEPFYIGRAPAVLTVKNSTLTSFVEDVKIFTSDLNLEQGKILVTKIFTYVSCIFNLLYLKQ
jgi:hypothetical protein